jgi:hypothetical protein
MNRLLFGIMAASLIGLAGDVEEVEAQFIWGVHVPYAVDTFDGTAGIGGRVGWDLPVLPIDIVGVGEYFFPDCGAEDCSFWGGSVEANVRLPIPIVRPYVLGGLAYRKISGLETSTDTVDSFDGTGVSAGIGLDFDLLAVRAFLDGRYEWLGEDQLEQFVVRVGVVF